MRTSNQVFSSMVMTMSLSSTKSLATLVMMTALVGACGQARPLPPLDSPAMDAVVIDTPSAQCSGAQRQCMGVCTDLSSDRENCGGCGVRCMNGQACVSGMCTASCPSGQNLCGNECATLGSDPRHCGACGRACAAGELCSVGRCSTTCAAGLTACGGGGDGGVGLRLCVDTQTDPRHCGACGMACPAGQACAGGRCVVMCGAGLTECSGACVDTQRDPSHCGACGMACPAGQVCGMGVCSASCPTGQTACGGSCVNTAVDVRHCGACGMACPAGQSCQMGMCRPACATGQTDCMGVCVDLATDRSNCGMCGNACPTGQSCQMGMCAPACATGQAACGGRCVDLSSDRANCGRCGTTCAAGQLCNMGVCAAACGAGQTECSGRCVNTQTDVANCGGCGIACPAGFACTMGGCFPLEGTDAGACLPPSLQCGAACTDVRNDNANCGRCGNACADDRTCVEGMCVPFCAMGETRCGAVCADLARDDRNCGACGRACPAGEVCFAGACGAARPTRYIQAGSMQPFINACAEPGARTILTNVDDQMTLVTLPFPVRFWDRDMPSGASIGVSSNGYVQMNSMLNSTLSGTIPSASTPNAVIAPYWGDNYTSATGICVATVGAAPNRRFVIQWDDAYHCCSRGTTSTTYEIIISETTGIIDIVYRTMTDARESTVGIENDTGMLHVGGCPMGATRCTPATGSATRFIPVP